VRGKRKTEEQICIDIPEQSLRCLFTHLCMHHIFSNCKHRQLKCVSEKEVGEGKGMKQVTKN
jgi:hypothetical protein